MLPRASVVLGGRQAIWRLELDRADTAGVGIDSGTENDIRKKLYFFHSCLIVTFVKFWTVAYQLLGYGCGSKDWQPCQYCFHSVLGTHTL